MVADGGQHGDTNVVSVGFGLSIDPTSGECFGDEIDRDRNRVGSRDRHRVGKRIGVIRPNVLLFFLLNFVTTQQQCIVTSSLIHCCISNGYIHPTGIDE